MDLQIEVNDSRRVIKTDGFLIYGSKEDLTTLARAIEDAISKGLVLGFVGIGVYDKNFAFPNNGKPTLPTKNWTESLLPTPTPP